MLRGLLPGLPGGGGVTSAADEVPNSREMILRRWVGAGAEGCTEEGMASNGGTGDGAEGEVEETPRDSWGAGWGVLGLELPVDTALGGTTGDWEPEDGLCPLAAKGGAWPRLRASIISRKLGGAKWQGMRTQLPVDPPSPRLSGLSAPFAFLLLGAG